MPLRRPHAAMRSRRATRRSRSSQCAGCRARAGRAPRRAHTGRADADRAAPAAARAPVQPRRPRSVAAAMPCRSPRSATKPTRKPRFRSLKPRYPQALAGHQTIVRRVDLGTKGIYLPRHVRALRHSDEAGRACCSSSRRPAAAASSIGFKRASLDPRVGRGLIRSHAHRAFITGLAGPTLTANERAFLREARPWGLILFKRNISTRSKYQN